MKLPFDTFAKINIIVKNMEKNAMKGLFKTAGAVSAAAILVFIFFNYHSDIAPEKLIKKYRLPSSRFIEVKGTRVHYSIEGEGENLLLIHGTSSSLHTWQTWTDILKNHYRIIRLDLPAYGLTGPNKKHDYSEKWYDAFLTAFLDKTGVKKCHLAGNSRGGAIAWYFAARHPRRTGGLILINAAGYPYKNDISFVFWLAKNRFLGKIGSRITPRYMVKKSLKEVYYDESKITPALVDRHFNLLLRKGNREAFIARSKNQKPYSSNLIKRIKAPALIMWGAQDRWIAPENATRFKKDIPRSEVIIYPRAGHVPMEEIPRQTAQDALKFLKKLKL